MSFSLNSIKLIGFVSGGLITSPQGSELTLLVHPFAEKYQEALALQSSGLLVRVRVSAACEEYLELLREGDRLFVEGILARTNRAGTDDGTTEHRPLVESLRLERIETLKSIARFSHPLNPHGFSVRWSSFRQDQESAK
jgi:hypothetical protein